MIISAAKATEAASVLDVKLEGLSASAVQRAYRNKAKECHPDQHGTGKLQQWARVSWAKEVLGFWLKHHPPEEAPKQELAQSGDCRACSGTGRVPMVRRGFGKPLTMSCVVCHGLGSVIEEEDDHD